MARGEGTRRIQNANVSFGPDGVGRVDVKALSEGDAVVGLILDLAKKHDVTVGFFGGTARDLFTGRDRGRSSDVDLIFDSRQAGFLEFQKALLRESQLRFAKAPPQIDFSVDRNPAHRMLGPYRGVTIEKLGVLADGTVLDFTGRGLEDLASGTLRYYCPDPYRAPGISSIFRMVGALIQNPNMGFAPQTEAEIGRVMRELYGPTSDNVKKLSSARSRRLVYGPLTAVYNAVLRRFVEGGLRTGWVGKLFSRAGEWKREGRKRHGENLFDFMRTFGKIAKGNQESNPARAFAELKRHRLVDFLESIGAGADLAPLRDAAERQLDASFRGSLQTLRSRAAADNARHGLRQYAANLRVRGQDALADRVEAKTRSVSDVLPPGEDVAAALERILAPFIRQKAIDSADLRQTLDAIFVRSRGNDRIPESFGVLEPRAFPASAGPPPALEVQRGFDGDIAKWDPDSPHSMKDLGGYVAARLGTFLPRDLVENRRSIELHRGSPEEVFRSLSARGFSQVARVTAPKTATFNQIYVAQSDSGELRYVVTGIHGEDRLRHWQHLLRAASFDGARIEPSQVEVHRNPDLDRVDNYRHFSTALLRAGAVPNEAIIGFKNTLIRELDRRQSAADKVGWLAQELGPNPHAALVSRLERAGERSLAVSVRDDADLSRILRSPSHAMLSRRADVACLERLEVELARVGGAGLLVDGRIPSPAGSVAKNTGTTFSDQAMVTYVDRDGARRALLLARTPYGDLAGDLGLALSDLGVERILQLGTGGGLRPDAKIGDIELPASVADDQRPEKERIANALLSLLSEGPGQENVRRGGEAFSVGTPLDETRARIEHLKSTGVSVVDVELADLVRGVKESPTPAQVGVAQIVTDRPGQTETLESHIPRGPMEASLSQLTDLLIDALRIERLEREPPSQDARSGFDQAKVVAERLLEARGHSRPGRELLTYNLSRYIVNGSSDAGLGWLADHYRGESDTLSKVVSPRWLEKLERETEAPATNEAVLQRVRDLSAKGARLVKFLKAEGADPKTYRLYLMGSLTKGRASAGSDLDLLLRTDDKALEAKVIRSEFGYMGAKDPAFTVGTFDYVAARMDFYRPPVDIGDGSVFLDPEAFLDLYSDIAKGYGVTIDRATGKVFVTFDPNVVADSCAREVPRVAERILEHEKRYREFFDTDFILDAMRSLPDAPELAHIPLARLIDIGEDVMTALAPRRLTAERVLAFFQGPVGAAILDASEPPISQADIPSLLQRVPLTAIPDLLGVTDPVKRMALVFAGAERLKNQGARATHPFARELEQGWSSGVAR
ncbi:MAG: hypothetical protein HYV07_11570 [Deltaproteobacteria bacterium]|nr:hypothetical protein [Deltaproteobacteria bacterium]